MRRSSSVFAQVFLGVAAVALGAVAIVGLVARWALSSAFTAYVARLPASPMRPGMRMGQMVLGRAEQTFIAQVDRAVLVGAAIAVVLALVGAYLIARHLTAPLRDLESAAMRLASGDLGSRVEVAGPAEIAALGDAFNHMADSLSEAEELRRRLVADVAHELRNPLAAARAQAEGMAEGVLAADEARLSSVVDDMTHLSRLVDDLQELAVAEAGRLRYDMRACDIAALVREEAERAVLLAAPAVSVVVHANDGLLVRGDEHRLAEVLKNLLANAVRHTSEGHITVDARREGDRVAVRVIDTGDGIPDADLPYVFERFYRADTARAAHTGGAGLGLAISRRIIVDHGGEVFAEHTPGGGATVGFKIPSLTT